MVSCCPAPSTASVRSWQKTFPSGFLRLSAYSKQGKGTLACSLASSQVMELLQDAQGISHAALGQLRRTWLSLGCWGMESWSSRAPSHPRANSAADRTLLASSSQRHSTPRGWSQCWGLHSLTQPGRSLRGHTALAAHKSSL